jgi:hypothetical protein
LTGTPSRRQDSTTDRIAATLGPDFALPTCNQFFLPNAIGRIEFSATLLDNGRENGVLATNRTISLI